MLYPASEVIFGESNIQEAAKSKAHGAERKEIRAESREQEAES